jgi:hypothetical protein
MPMFYRATLSIGMHADGRVQQPPASPRRCRSKGPARPTRAKSAQGRLGESAGRRLGCRPWRRSRSRVYFGRAKLWLMSCDRIDCAASRVTTMMRQANRLACVHAY